MTNKDLLSDVNIQNEKFVKEHLEEIKEAIGNGDIPDKLKQNEDLFDLYYKEHNEKMLSQFSEYIVLERYIKDNLAAIKEEIGDGSLCSSLDSKVLFDSYIDDKNYEILLKFPMNFFTEEIIKEHLEGIRNLIDNMSEIPYQFINSRVLFDSYVKDKKFDKLFQFNEIFFTEEFIKEHIEEIRNLIDNMPNIPYHFTNSKVLFDSYAKDKKIDKLFQFNEIFFTEEIIKDNLREIRDLINDMSGIPYHFTNSRVLFDSYVKDKNYKMASAFSDSLFNEVFVENHLKELKDFINTNTNNCFIQCRLWNSKVLLNSYFEDKNYNIILLFNRNLFTDEFIKNYLKEIKKFTDSIQDIPLNFKKSLSLCNLYIEEKNYKMILLFDEKSIREKCYEKREYNALQYLYIDPAILENEDILKIYSESLKIDCSELKKAINELYRRNDEIFDTLIADFLSKYKDIPIKEYERLSLYPNMQIIINSLDKKFFSIFNIILKKVKKQSENYDIYPAIYNAIINFPNYQELIKSINPEDLDEKSVNSLMYILQKKTNLFSINTFEDLCNFEQKRDIYFSKIDKKIENCDIDILNLKSALLEKKYGLSLEMANFIIKRYCSDLDSLKKNINDLDDMCISTDTYNLLYDITTIFQNDNIDKLVYLYQNSTRIKTDFSTAFMFESMIRKEYANMYNSSLYKIKDEHKINRTNFTNGAAYDLLNEAEYHGKKPQIYAVDGNFNLQIHSLGAYRHFDKPDNFKDYWQRPKVSYHAICTSYIRNDEIAPANVLYPVYGFDNYENSALLCAGNYDLYSDKAIKDFATSIVEPYKFFPPNVMINKTRHVYNEIVIERLNSKGKRLPNYVVYFVDDINNMENYKKENELFNETVQAAID